MPAHQLLLIRHARAADSTVDIERPLTGDGRRDAVELGKALKELALRPGRLVVSAAKRAQETAREARLTDELIIDDRIYVNTTEALFELIGETPEAIEILAVVGHNPSIHDVARALHDENPALNRGFPAGAFAVFDVESSWKDIQLGTARLTRFWTLSADCVSDS